MLMKWNDYTIHHVKLKMCLLAWIVKCQLLRLPIIHFTFIYVLLYECIGDKPDMKSIRYWGIRIVYVRHAHIKGGVLLLMQLCTSNSDYGFYAPHLDNSLDD